MSTHPTLSTLPTGVYLSGMRSRIYHYLILRFVGVAEGTPRFCEVYPTYGDWSKPQETESYPIERATVNRWLKQGCYFAATIETLRSLPTGTPAREEG